MQENETDVWCLAEFDKAQNEIKENGFYNPTPYKEPTKTDEIAEKSQLAMEAMEAMKADARAITLGESTRMIVEPRQLKTMDVKGVSAALQTITYTDGKKTEEFRGGPGILAQAC